jgi:hypothetical protein
LESTKKKTNTNKNFYPQSYQSWLQNDALRKETKEKLTELYYTPKAQFKNQDFTKRVIITGFATPCVYYRKISDGEYNAIKSEKSPFHNTFEYQNTDNYCYWMSSSLEKVKLFGNENSTDDSSHVIMIQFKKDPRDMFPLKAHQEPGVQNTPDVVALHREGFAEFGNINNDKQVGEILDNNMDHNLGFTDCHDKALTSLCADWKLVSIEEQSEAHE